MADLGREPVRGHVQEKTAFLHVWDVIPECSCVVEHAAPLYRLVFRWWEGGKVTKLAESCIESEGRCQSR